MTAQHRERGGGGRRSAATKQEQNILKAIWPELVRTNHKFRPAFFLHASGCSQSLVSPACSPFSEPAVHPAEGRPRAREGEELERERRLSWPALALEENRGREENILFPAI